MKKFLSALIALSLYTPAGAIVIGTVPHDLISLALLVPVLVFLALFTYITALLIHDAII